jgi:hypothetical protein
MLAAGPELIGAISIFHQEVRRFTDKLSIGVELGPPIGIQKGPL